jgi:hypothetical protein
MARAKYDIFIAKSGINGFNGYNERSESTG